MNVAAVNTHRGVSTYEIDGTILMLHSYDLHLTPGERQDAQRVVAFGAVWDSLACRMAAKPRRANA
jgi:hypothetical protein